MKKRHTTSEQCKAYADGLWNEALASKNVERIKTAMTLAQGSENGLLWLERANRAISLKNHIEDTWSEKDDEAQALYELNREKAIEGLRSKWPNFRPKPS